MAKCGIAISMIRSLLKNLDSDALKRHQVRQLRDPVVRIRDMLRVADEKNQSDDVTVEDWFRSLGNTLSEADDLVDEIAASKLLRGLSLFTFTPIIGLSMACQNQIKRLRNALDELAQAGTQLGFDVPSNHDERGNQLTSDVPDEKRNQLDFDVPDDRNDQLVLYAAPNPDENRGKENNTSRFMLEEEVEGRNEDKERIVDLLLHTGMFYFNISVVTIGMGEIAKIVFDDARVKAHFDLRVWVIVKEDIDLETIIRGIIEAGEKSKFNNLNMDQLIHQLRREIDGKILLLVLDDVWIEDHIQQLLFLLSGGARGSKILVTTRSPEVVEKRTSCRSEVRRSPADKRVEELARELALLRDRSRGTKTHAFRTRSLLLRERSKKQLLSRPTDLTDKFVQDILMPSYENFQQEIKPCFAYCSLFPRDLEFNILDTVSLWMAQGFLEPEQLGGDQRDLEDIGEEYFQTLVHAHFFQKVTRDELDEPVICKMHNIISDLAQFVARDSSTLRNSSGLSEVRNTVRHRYLVQGGDDASQRQESLVLNERTFLRCVSPEYSHRVTGVNNVIARDNDLSSMRKSIDTMNMSNFKRVRVLDLHAFGIKTLPDSIGELIHLRYLDLSHNKSLVKLPNSIAKLYYLQTLKLGFCFELKELPSSIGRLFHLRRLEIDGCDSLTFMPPGFEKLSTLRTLSRYIVGSPHSESKASSGLEALGNMNHLRGRLTIELSKGWKRVVKESTRSNLSQKNFLRELGIRWQPTRNNKEDDSLEYQQLLEGLQPHPNLKVLSIEGYKGHDFPSWAKGDSLASALPNLVTVSIEGSGECKTLPPFSRLQFLKRLTLRFMDEVQFVEETDQQPSPFFPSLEELTLHSFYSLETWWKKQEVRQLSETRASLSFPCLLKLKLWSCPKLTSMPLFPSVRVLDLRNINKELLEAPIESSSSSSSNSLPSGHPQNLPRLRSLQITGCPNLKTLQPFGKSSGELEKLVVERLNELTSLVDGLQQLTSLKELEIASCKDLDLSDREQKSSSSSSSSMPWESLSELRHLTLRELPKLSTLPNGLRRAKKLRYLCISACKSLSCLPDWIRAFTSLQHLRLEGCPALTTLPEGLKGVSSLLKVDITECAGLIKRCKHGGEEWHKIKHARILLHKSWRYALMSEVESSWKPQNHGDNVTVHVDDPTIHVGVTVSRPR